MVSVKTISIKSIRKLEEVSSLILIVILIHSHQKSSLKSTDVRVFTAGSRGLRRVGAETETKPAPPPKARSNLNSKASSAVSVPVNKQKHEVVKTPNDTTLEEVVNLEESMSTSLEDATYYKPRSKRKSEEKVSTSEDVVDSEDDTVEDVPVVRGVSLKDFQSHQKMMEEQNKQKKDLLYKAIEQQ